jgi:hypothetical protein
MHSSLLFNMYKLLSISSHPILPSLQNHLRGSCDTLVHSPYLVDRKKRTHDPESGMASCARTWSLSCVSTSAASPDASPNSPPGAVGGRYGSGCFHFSSSASVSLMSSCNVLLASSLYLLSMCCIAPAQGIERRTLCRLGSVTALFASNRLRRYSAWPRQRYRWTAQSRESLRDRL